MDNFSVIIRPLVTEQGMHFANVKGAYSFQVNQRANKTEIKNAVEKIYGVKVDKVRTANHKGKRRDLELEESRRVPGAGVSHRSVLAGRIFRKR
jgi:large subunit ribosomal protein L23